MPLCDNCGSHVSDDYFRVCSIDGIVPACPQCPDRFMDPQAAGGFREYANDGAGARTGAETEIAELAVDGGKS